MIKNKNEISRILFITLSNIGDIVLTLPVLSVLKREFPEARIDVISGPNGKEIFTGHPFVSGFVPYDKFLNIQGKWQFIMSLRQNRYDLVVDLKNSLFGIFIGPKYRTPFIQGIADCARHKKDEHLWKMKNLGLDAEEAGSAFHIGRLDEITVSQLLIDIKTKKDFVVVAPGAKSHIKRWTEKGFTAVCDSLIEETGVDIVIVGDNSDKKIVTGITSNMKHGAIDLTAKLTLRQLGALLKRARLLITNDSAPLHIGCAVGTAVLAIFGPTDPKKYGPTGKDDAVIRKDLPCSPCEEAQCARIRECMFEIGADEVFEAARRMLANK